MSPTVTRGSVVVVGIDGIGSADDALDWAAAEAAARGCQLRIVHVFHPPPLVERAEPFGLDMGRPHQVALAAATGRLDHADAVISALERAVVHRRFRSDDPVRLLFAGLTAWGACPQLA